jgi:hypothetical protein
MNQVHVCMCCICSSLIRELIQYGCVSSMTHNTVSSLQCHNVICNIARGVCVFDVYTGVPIVAFQIVTQYINITGFPLPNIYRKFLAWTDAFYLDLGWLLSLGCLTRVNFYQKLLIITIGPFIAMVVLACTYAIVRHKDRVQAVDTSQRVLAPERTARLEKASTQHCLVFLTMTFLIYSTVSTTVFQTFSCDNIDDDAPTRSYLRADYSIQCGTPQHKLYKIYAAVMIIIYPIGK